ncbi:MAG: 30S ribosomal protein S6 [Coriobacteriales bacterium]|jgi:small subunit ribosomal protein S6|nr:30S ribosomal protein S6 [Coriobacteriales bacterium]
MKAYELLYFVSPTLAEDERTAALKKVETTIVSQNGLVDTVEEWGKKKLAFEVDRLTDGDYILVDFHADPSSIAELDRVLRITDAVKRFMIVSRADRDKKSNAA